MRRRGAVAAAIAAVWLAGCVAGCNGGNAGISDATPVPVVQTATAQMRPIENVIEAQGTVFPVQQASLSPKVSAPVQEYFVNRGTHVHKGQLLAVLANQDLKAAALSAKGSYDQAQAEYEATTQSTLPEEIEAAQTAVDDAKSALQENRRLYESDRNLYQQGAIAQKDVEAAHVALIAAQTTYEKAETHLKDLKSSGVTQAQRAAKGQMEAAQGQYLSAEAQLQYSELRSPIDGVVASRAVYPGDVAPAGTPLLIVMQISKVIVQLHIPEALAEQLHVGDAAKIAAPGIPQPIPAKVTIISPALDPNSTTNEVWVEAENPHDELAPGTSVGVSIVAKKIPQALTVPESAVLVSEKATAEAMTVGADGVAHAQPVVTGIRNAGMVQILSGLHAGETVIVGGAYGLPDGTKVQAQPETGSGGSQS